MEPWPEKTALGDRGGGVHHGPRQGRARRQSSPPLQDGRPGPGGSRAASTGFSHGLRHKGQPSGSGAGPRSPWARTVTRCARPAVPVVDRIQGPPRPLRSPVIRKKATASWFSRSTDLQPGAGATGIRGAFPMGVTVRSRTWTGVSALSSVHTKNFQLRSVTSSKSRCRDRLTGLKGERWVMSCFWVWMR
jgi:hypothetical protein